MSSQSPDQPPRIALIDYGMGNLQSVRNALIKVGAEVELIHDRPTDDSRFHGMVLPGVGAMGDCARTLREQGLADWITNWIRSDRPFLGICLGLQALFEWTEEGDCPGLGIFPGKVKRFRLPPEFKIPHMGWNQIKVEQDSPLFKDIDTKRAQIYFVHSYFVEPTDPSLALTTTDYGGPFVSSIQRGRCFATQFHPEKSQAVGLTLFRNFLDIASS